MRFDQLKIHDAVLAILIVLVAVLAGSSYRDALARRFAAPSAPITSIPEVKHDTPPPPVRLPRVITKLPAGAKIFAQPGTTAKPIAQLKAGAVVERSASNQEGWVRVRSLSGTEGWTSESSLVTEAESAGAITLFDSAVGMTGAKLSASRAGVLYSSSGLTDRIGSFVRGEKLEVLKPGGRAVLVAMSDGAGGKIIAYAKNAEIRNVGTSPSTPAKPVVAVNADPLAGGPGSAAGEPPSTTSADLPLKEAQDQYASGNFEEARAKAEEAIALGSSDGIAISAMASCKLGDVDRAMRYVKRLRGAKLTQVRAVCSAAQPPPKPVDNGSAQSPPSPSDELERP